MYPLYRNHRAVLLVISLVFAGTMAATAQGPASTLPEIGIRGRVQSLIALTGARIVTPDNVIDAGVLLIQDGVIKAVGQAIDVPAGTQSIDLSGKVIYPALIDAYSEETLEQPQSKAAHWNKHVRPERDSILNWTRNADQDKKLRAAGFALRLVASADGILRGTSGIVTTGDTAAADSIVAARVAHHIRLTAPKGRGRDYYPNSPMGAVALARQAFYDADWYAEAWRVFESAKVRRPEYNVALEELGRAKRNDGLFVFDAIDEQYALRADRFAREFGLNNIALLGSGREYQRLDAIRALDHPLILPVNFPKPPNVATADATRDASLSELMHWHFAPENLARLQSAGAQFSLTTHGLDDKKKFVKSLRAAVKRGLNPNVALQACTSVPAELFGIDDKAGSIAVGKAAHLMITDGDWLAKETKVVETWVDGKRFQHDPHHHDEAVGTWKLELTTKDEQRQTLFLAITEKSGKLSGKASLTEPEPPSDDEKEEEEETEHKDDDDDEHGHEHEEGGEHEHEHEHDENHKGDHEGDEDKADDDEPVKDVSLKDLHASFNRLTTNFSSKIWQAKGTVRLSGTVITKNRLFGALLDETGTRVSFQGVRVLTDKDDKSIDESKAEDEDDEQEKHDESKEDAAANDKADAFKLEINYPLGANGVLQQHSTDTPVLFENATIWTCNEDGEILRESDVLVVDGKIAAVGQKLKLPANTKRVSAKNKHISPGIVDCHSHMATDGGVNEGTQAITAEVRIGDFINATDIAIYQQLAGGVTTANVLHGSANPIGGQNQVIKLRWGQLPEALKFKAAPQGIKFALGENVKQSNWGAEFTTRYPQTRMGVEQIMRDAFIAAQQYEQRWADWRRDRSGIPPRKDLELDAISEIVNGTRWIHCHSYRQDEILALMRTLESFQIRIGTFQHILEGYKVAKEMAEHGAMGSSFSDWWAYKFEVYDAIPYNGALMHRAGVVVSFNSDDRELARHLNHEAAKAVKYGGLSPNEALKFVTLNPAKQLRIEQHVGSIEVGKDADLVIWSGDPLQITSRCEQTWIDGIRYFDIDADRANRESQTQIREQLIRLILDSGEDMKKPGEREQLFRDLWPNHDEYCGHGH